jgi:metallo-beta-lactamase class B
MKNPGQVAFPPETKPPILTIRPGLPPWQNPPPRMDFSPMEPTRLFDNFYFVGTRSVGAFIIKTSDGLVMLDTGWNEKDCAQSVFDLKKLGLDPTTIKLILVSHEHIDHYGGVQYLKSSVCPDAKVAMSLVGWNYLMIRPIEMAYDNPRPQSVDIFLADKDKITQGHTTIHVVATPGHSPGCLSFIIPVTDKDEPHVVGIMGGTAVPSNWNEAFLYYSSIDYFMGFTRPFRCDIGLGTHASYLEGDMKVLRARKSDDPNPLIIGPERFETEYMQMYRDLFYATAKRLPPDSPSILLRQS